MLDIDWGMYLFVMLFGIVVLVVVVGIGFGVVKFGYVLGVMKVYVMWVGGGLFFIELIDVIGEMLCVCG